MAQCREAPDNETSGIRNLEAPTVGMSYTRTKDDHEQFALSTFGFINQREGDGPSIVDFRPMRSPRPERNGRTQNWHRGQVSLGTNSAWNSGDGVAATDPASAGTAS